MRRRLEMHHIAGKYNSDMTVPLCVPCHNDITMHQKIWDTRWTHQDNSESLKNAFITHGIRELLLLKHMKTHDITYYYLADSLCYNIGELLVKE